MNSPSSLVDRPEIRLTVYALALMGPPLLAYNRTPSATQLNELLCVLGWGLCLLAANSTLAVDIRRGATLVLHLALAVMGLAIMASWAFGSLPTSLALPPLLSLIAAGFVASLGARSAQGGEIEGMQAFAPFAFGMVCVGVLSAIIAVIQVYLPSLADGELIAQSGLAGRAVGNLRQPNHLASLLIWSVIALVPLVEWGRIPRWLGAAAGLLLMAAVVLSGSRTGLVAGTAVLVVYALADWKLSWPTRIALLATVVFPLGVVLWPWLTAHLSFVPHAAGAATRLSEGDSSHFAIWRNAIEMIRQQPWLGVGWGEFNFAWTLTPFPNRPTAFFDHTHDLPLQLIVELGLPIALLVLGMMAWALFQGLRRAWSMQGEAGIGGRAAWMMILMIAAHSLDEYPLWYCYFLLPSAWAWGFALGCGSSGTAKPRRAAGLAEPAQSGRIVRVGSEGMGLRWFGGAMVAAALFFTWDYLRVSTIFSDDPGLPPLATRISAGESSLLFAHHADYAEATTTEPPSRALGALARSTHSLLDSRLMMA